MNLPNSAIASATVQMVVPLLMGLVVWPLYVLGRSWYGQVAALRVAVLWPFIPSIALWATRWNHLYTIFTILSFLSLHYALERHRLRGFFLSGLIISAASFFSFGNLALAGFLAIYVLLWLLFHREQFRWGWYVLAVLFFVAGLGLVWLGAFILFDLRLWSLWQTAMEVHFGLGRSYWTWLFFHLYDFFVFLGLPLAVLLVVRSVQSLRSIPAGPDIPLFSFMIGLLLLNLSGTSQGEVARVWAFLLPLALITAVGRLKYKRLVFPGIVFLLGLQLFVSNVFLRTVGTGLSDPPEPPAGQQQSVGEPVAKWAGGPILQDIAFPEEITAGEQLTIQTQWTTAEPVDRAYTLFYHLLDEEGNLVAQADSMPLEGRWPTTCWQSDAAFMDSVQLTIPESTLPANYQLQMGFYWLPTGERLPLQSPLGEILIIGTVMIP